MTAATSATMNLPEKSVSWIQGLIQINLDSRDGFKDAAQHLKDEHSTLEAMFRRLGVERDAQAKELQTLVAKNAEKPQKSGSAYGRGSPRMDGSSQCLRRRRARDSQRSRTG